MAYNYFEDRFIDENFREEIIVKNTNKIFLIDLFLMKRQMVKDHKWVVENLKKLEHHKRYSSLPKPSDINSLEPILKTSNG